MSDQGDPVDPEVPETPTEGAPAVNEVELGRAVSHMVGVSHPTDEYSPRPSRRDGMTDDELLAMGIEPDETPSGYIMFAFTALIVVLAVVSFGIGALFSVVAVDRVENAADAQAHLLLATRTEADAVIGAFDVVERDGGARGYRMPITVAMDVLVQRPALLVRHPMGARDVVPPPPGAEGDGGVEGSPTLQLNAPQFTGGAGLHLELGGGGQPLQLGAPAALRLQGAAVDGAADEPAPSDVGDDAAPEAPEGDL